MLQLQHDHPDFPLGAFALAIEMEGGLVGLCRPLSGRAGMWREGELWWGDRIPSSLSQGKGAYAKSGQC